MTDNYEYDNIMSLAKKAGYKKLWLCVTLGDKEIGQSLTR